MATIQLTRVERSKKTDAPVLVRITTDDGRVLLFEADAGDFSRGLAAHRPFSVETCEPEVARPRAI